MQVNLWNVDIKWVKQAGLPLKGDKIHSFEINNGLTWEKDVGFVQIFFLFHANMSHADFIR